MTASVQPVARPKGDLTQADYNRLVRAVGRWELAEQEMKQAVAAAVEASSFRAVSEATGFSTNTLQRWKREAGK